MVEKLPCADCSLHSINEANRVEACIQLAQDIVHRWWHNDPTLTLRDVASDMMRGEALSEQEEAALDDCMAEHSSIRCDNLSPYGL